MSRIALCSLVEDEVTNSEIDEELIGNDEPTAEIEMAVAGNEVENQIQDTNKALDITEALESICEILKTGGPLVTATESRLINVTTALALSGTNIQPNQFIPSMESMELSTALENVENKANGIFSKILGGIKNIFTSIKNFLSKIIFFFRSLEGKVKKTREYLDRLKSQGLKTIEDYESKFRPVLNIDGKPINKMSDFVKQFTTTAKVSLDILKFGLEAAKTTESNGNILGTIFDLTKVEETGTRYFKDADEYTKEMVSKLKLRKDRTINGCEVYKNQISLLGNVSYGVERPDPKRYIFTEYAEMKRCGHMFKVTLDVENFTAKEKTTFDVIKIEDLYKVVEESQNIISEFNKRLNDIWRIWNTAESEVTAIAVSSTILHVSLSVLFSYRMMVTNTNLMQGTLQIMNYIGYYIINGSMWFVREVSKAKGWK